MARTRDRIHWRPHLKKGHSQGPLHLLIVKSRLLCQFSQTERELPVLSCLLEKHLLRLWEKGRREKKKATPVRLSDAAAQRTRAAAIRITLQLTHSERTCASMSHASIPAHWALRSGVAFSPAPPPEDEEEGAEEEEPTPPEAAPGEPLTPAMSCRSEKEPAAHLECEGGRGRHMI